MYALLFLIAAAQDKRLPEPSAAEQRDAEKLIREVFKDEYARRTDMPGLAKKLLQKATANKDHPTQCFVLLKEARDVAASAGDVETALAAISLLTQIFSVSGVDMKVAALTKAGPALRGPEGARKLALAWLEVADDAVTADKLDAGAAAVSKGEAAARAAQDNPLVSLIQARGREIADLQRESQRVKNAEKAIQSNPADAPSYLIVGRYWCLVKNEWAAGLPMLAQGSDAALKDLAEKEMAKPSGAAAQADVGDGWWDLAEKEKNLAMKTRLQMRARHWYELAFPKLDGLVRLKVEKRLAQEVKQQLPGQGIDLLKLVDLQKDSVRGTWQAAPEGGFVSGTRSRERLMIPYSPPEEYDLTVVVEPKDTRGEFALGLFAGGRQFMAVFRAGKGSKITVGDTLDGNDPEYKNKFLPDSGPATIVVSIRKSSLVITVDGVKTIDWKAAYDQLSLDPDFAVPEKKCLFLVSDNSSVHFKKATLTPVSGQGQRLR